MANKITKYVKLTEQEMRSGCKKSLMFGSYPQKINIPPGVREGSELSVIPREELGVAEIRVIIEKSKQQTRKFSSVDNNKRDNSKSKNENDLGIFIFIGAVIICIIIIICTEGRALIPCAVVLFFLYHEAFDKK